MKRYIARHILIARLAALALSAVWFLQAPAQAQGMGGHIVIFPSIGVTPDQSIRLTLFNRDGAPIRAQARLHTSGGVLILLGDGSVRAGTSHSFDFKRRDIPLSGEEGTGRLQLIASFQIGMAAPGEFKGLAVSMETVSISDGTSNTVFFAEVPPSRNGGDGNDTLIWTLEKAFSRGSRETFVGIIPGQRMRGTLSNHSSFGPEGHRKPVIGRMQFFDGSGNLIAQSDELVIPPGESRSFDIDRDALRLAGEPGTGRAQGRWSLLVSDSDTQDAGTTSPIVASFELIDNSTGRTTVNPSISNSFAHATFRFGS